ncbi:hypothetical protein B566_EDAN010302 [Ephemera danica]|nr:hypothetical protein B566_EDAN010302 [Ephemera danica]
MRKLYYPLRQLLELAESEQNQADSRSAGTGHMGTALISYSRSLLEHLPSDAACAVLHMDTILSDKFSLSSLECRMRKLYYPLRQLLELAENEQNQADSRSAGTGHMGTALISYSRSLLEHLPSDAACAVLHMDTILSDKFSLSSLGARAHHADPKSMNLALCALRSVAHELMVRGELDASVALYQDVLERQYMMIGEESGDCMVTEIGICDVMARQGKVYEARKKFEQVVQAKQEKLGNYHPETLAALGALAYFLSNNFT